MRYQKAIVVIIEKAYCFHDFMYVCIYDMYKSQKSKKVKAIFTLKTLISHVRYGNYTPLYNFMIQQYKPDHE